MISKIIHQIWFGPKPPPLKIMNSWRKYCDKFGWKYCLWDESMVERLNLVNRHIYDFYKSGCNGIFETPHYHGMANIARLEIVNGFGGYYMDCDIYSWGINIENIVSLDHDMAILHSENNIPDNISMSKCSIALNHFTGNFDSAHFVGNSLFYANKNNNILCEMINGLDTIFQKHSGMIQNGIPLTCSSPKTCGAWQLSHFSKKYPFILLSPKFALSDIQYCINNSAFYMENKFKDNIISSIISNYDESILKLIEEYERT